jgi:hypothetical protein
VLKVTQLSLEHSFSNLLPLIWVALPETIQNLGCSPLEGFHVVMASATDVCDPEK